MFPKKSITDKIKEISNGIKVLFVKTYFSRSNLENAKDIDAKDIDAKDIVSVQFKTCHLPL